MWLTIDATGSVWVCLTDDDPAMVTESFVAGVSTAHAIAVFEQAARQLREARISYEDTPGYHAEVIGS